jgi:adenosylcobinamide kinase/adenosylcobinamide-phosphate guanylyltransferase
MYLSKHDLTGKVAVIDCVTLWLTNWLTASSIGIDAVDAILSAAKKEFDAFTKADATYIFVTNEIGLGGVSKNALQRQFTDLQGWMNQYIAQKADEVILMVSGIEMKVK